MRRAFLATAVCCSALTVSAQTLVDAAMAASAVKDYESRGGIRPLRCEVSQILPTLNFALRYQAGYDFSIPVTQYQGSNHTWYVLTKITPEGGDERPAYLFARTNVSEVGKDDLHFVVHGAYLLGEGRYKAEATLYDDTGRACKRDWRVDVIPGHKERAIAPALPPYTIREVTDRAPGIAAKRSDGRAVRVTILMDAAPLSPRRLRLRPGDTRMLQDELTSVVERLPASSIRLIVFSLDQQKELYRSEAFSITSLEQVGNAINSLELAAVDVHVLQNAQGPADYLAGLVNRERSAVPAPDVILFLGPVARSDGRIPEELWANVPGHMPRFFYLQYKPQPRRPILPPDSEALGDVTTPPIRPPRPPANQNNDSQQGTASTDSSTNNSGPRPPGGAAGGGGGTGSGGGSGAGGGGRGRGGRGGPTPIPITGGPAEKDLINSAITHLKGETIVVHNPVELSQALAKVARK